MERPAVLLKKESRGGKPIFNLELQGGTDPGPQVEAEFVEISDKHSLPPEGGCYQVQAVVQGSDGDSIILFGGMYVQPQKRDGVLADLRALGYEILSESAA